VSKVAPSCLLAVNKLWTHEVYGILFSDANPNPDTNPKSNPN